MPYIKLQEVFEEIKNVHLNRAGVSNEQLLPVVVSEYRNFWQIMIENDVPFVNKVFTTVDVAANVTAIIHQNYGAIPITSRLAADFIEPVTLWEKADGALDTSYVKMKEMQRLPICSRGPELIYWNWAQDQINLIGATVARDVRIYGIYAAPNLNDVNDVVLLPSADGYLASAAASTAAANIMKNNKLADSIAIDRDKKLSRFLGRHVRKNQSIMVRRRGMRR